MKKFYNYFSLVTMLLAFIGIFTPQWQKAIDFFGLTNTEKIPYILAFLIAFHLFFLLSSPRWKKTDEEGRMIIYFFFSIYALIILINVLFLL